MPELLAQHPEANRERLLDDIGVARAKQEGRNRPSWMAAWQTAIALTSR
jgi:hypothetical protein